MQPDFLAEPGIPAPDQIPDELIARYGTRARQRVRYTRSIRYRTGKRLHSAAEPLHDTEVWSVASMVFFWGVALLAVLGGLAYAVYLWPRVGLTLLGSLLVLVGLSLVVALRMTRYRRAFR